MTSLDNLGPKKIITGPAMIYRNTNDEILVVIEREDKPRKQQGQFFVPAGKKRFEEPEDMLMTARRETEEEAGIPKDIINPDYFERKGVVCLETENEKLLFHVLSYKEKLNPDILETHSKFLKEEIIQRAFLNIYEIVKLENTKLRPGLVEILHLFCYEQQQEPTMARRGEYSPKDYKRLDCLKEEIVKKYFKK